MPQTETQIQPPNSHFPTQTVLVAPLKSPRLSAKGITGSLVPHLRPSFAFLENLAIPHFLQEICWEYWKVCSVRAPGGFTALVPLHLYPFIRFPLERCCGRSLELLEMDQVHIFSPPVFIWFEIPGITLKCALEHCCERIKEKNSLKAENHLQQQPE